MGVGGDSCERRVVVVVKGREGQSWKEVVGSLGDSLRRRAVLMSRFMMAMVS